MRAFSDVRRARGMASKPGSTTPYSRYAIYIAPPPDSDLWRFGCEVIGQDALTGAPCEGFAPEGQEPEASRRLTSEPRRDGFHATLKAPFAPRADLDIVGLMDHVAAFARTIAPFELGELGIGALRLDDGRAFAALTPTGPAQGDSYRQCRRELGHPSRRDALASLLRMRSLGRGRRLPPISDAA